MLNPLGVPSRMNIGQVLEVHLGWAAARTWSASATGAGQPPAELQKFLEELYNSVAARTCRSVSDDDLVEMAQNLTRRAVTRRRCSTVLRKKKSAC